jgi:SAM-dependent methyltransferase
VDRSTEEQSMQTSLPTNLPNSRQTTTTTAAPIVDARYLASVAELLRQHKQLSYQAMHLAPAQVVLDLGCGPGTDTIPLAHLLGPRGSVVGVDVDPALVAAADRRASAAGVRAQVRHVHADATRLPLPDATFDACRSERVFQHLAHPERALSELLRVTKPGGSVVVLDPDWGTLSIDSSDVAVERILARVRAERLFANGYSGRALFRLFRGHGLVNLKVQLLPLVTTDYPVVRKLTLLDRVEQEALACGALSLGELTVWLDGRTEAHRTGTFFASVSLVLMAGRKP